MYECLDCGKEFEIPTMDCDGEQLEKDIEVCPGCGSDDINEVDDYEDLDSNDDADLDLGDEEN